MGRGGFATETHACCVGVMSRFALSGECKACSVGRTGLETLQQCD